MLGWSIRGVSFRSLKFYIPYTKLRRKGETWQMMVADFSCFQFSYHFFLLRGTRANFFFEIFSSTQLALA